MSRLTSPLRRAIQRGLQEGGDIVKELRQLEEFSLTTRRDAEAVINALATLTPSQLVERREENDHVSPLRQLATWFELCSSEESLAQKTFHEKGVAQLVQAYDSVIALNHKENADDLIYVLNILTLFESKEGASRIIEATRRPLAPDSYWWQEIFHNLFQDHPHGEWVMRAIRAPLPDEKIAFQLLETSNEMMLAEIISEHPFDTPVGYKQLASWLTQPVDHPDDEDIPEVISASLAALAFVESREREALLKLAIQHPDKNVQLEAAWVAAKANHEFGVKALESLCKDIHSSAKAKSYLEEIGKRNAIPAEALEPNFAALARFSNLLPSLNVDKFDILDHRELTWLPNETKIKVWLIRHVTKEKYGLSPDRTTLGLVVDGRESCLAIDGIERRPIEDIYAIFKYCELEYAKLIQDSESEELLPLSHWLSQWKGEPVTDVELVSVVVANSELNLRNHTLALATAKKNDQSGWIVFDGPRTMWYPQAEQPSRDKGDYDDKAVLEIHLGRQLLGFPLEAKDRSICLNNTKPRTPEEIVSTYERLLDEIPTANSERQIELLKPFGPIETHFDSYLDAVVATRGTRREDSFVTLYERLLALSESFTGETKTALANSTLLISYFESYANILVSKNRNSDLLEFIRRYESTYEHHLGYSRLGKAALKAGDSALAEKLLFKLGENLFPAVNHPEEMIILAEIWKRKGNVQQGQQLLIECLIELNREIAEDEKKHRTHFEGAKRDKSNYRIFYQGFISLYPDSKNLLRKQGLRAEPSSINLQAIFPWIW
jgi:hypothetical protein